ncbi:MAG: helix-turn-helix domain-containing protein [Candidatus Omnitrophica bacterium]|nr:helix-turn-helix domain-containing protein [Candidatus Omnitrophota bacterium]
MKEVHSKNGDKVYTVPELARYLRMQPLTIYKHASSGKLPGFKIGSHWRFKKKTIDRWIHEQERSRTKTNGNILTNP